MKREKSIPRSSLLDASACPEEEREDRIREIKKLLRKAVSACVSDAAVARSIGISPQDLARCLTARDRHFALHDAFALPPIAKRIIADALCEELGGVFVETPDATNVTANFAKLIRSCAEFSASLSEAQIDGQISLAEARELEAKSLAAIKQLCAQSDVLKTRIEELSAPLSIAKKMAS